MLINLVTPCSRPENLAAIAKSINIPPENYRWIVVFDAPTLPDIELPNNAELYAHQQDESISGNAQRNYALALINDGYVMMLDDDTTLHSDLWSSVKGYTSDIICWKQDNKDGTHRVDAGKFALNHIDSGSFMVKRPVIGDTQWSVAVYGADGLYAVEVFTKSTSQQSVDKYLSTYNYLR